MKPFRFTLRAVHMLRENQERHAEEQYAHALGERARAAEQLRQAEQVITTVREHWMAQCRRVFAAADAIGFSAHFARLEQCRRECAQNVRRADADVSSALEALVAARQAREGVDKLFQKQKAAHDRALSVAEQKLLDEMGQRRVSGWRAAAIGRHS